MPWVMRDEIWAFGYRTLAEAVARCAASTSPTTAEVRPAGRSIRREPRTFHAQLVGQFDR